MLSLLDSTPHQLIPVLSKIVIKDNTNVINVTRILNNADTLTQQTVTFEMEIHRDIKDMKVSEYCKCRLPVSCVPCSFGRIFVGNILLLRGRAGR